MSNIDKQALLGADKHANQHRLSRLIIEANSAELRDIAEAVEQYTDQLIAVLADSEKHIAELESKNGNLRTIAHEQNELAIRANLDSINDAVEMDGLQKRIAETNQRNAELTARIEPMDRRIAELERSETQLINERDSAESALNDAYKAVMGQAPEWSNWFSFESAIDEIELACELWRNQTDDVIQFRQRIQELEAKLANPVLLPKTNGYWNEQEKAYEEAITLAKRQVRLAGFSVEDM
ncbi:TPA: ead/Ea22-like family protein [Salmonella enterica subsp. diarizonae serovar 61:r:z53]